jgi:hypothetical protein
MRRRFREVMEMLFKISLPAQASLCIDNRYSQCNLQAVSLIARKKKILIVSKKIKWHQIPAASDIDIRFAESLDEAGNYLELNRDVEVIFIERSQSIHKELKSFKALRAEPCLRCIASIAQNDPHALEQIKLSIEAGVYNFIPAAGEQTAFINERPIGLPAAAAKPVPGAIWNFCFLFQDLYDVCKLTETLSKLFPEPSRLAIGLRELMINAVEHGNLGISYEEKTKLLLEGEWENEVARRFEAPQNRNKLASIRLALDHDTPCVLIEDEGEGFSWEQYLKIHPENDTRPNGRGIAIALATSFSSLEYQGCGNRVLCHIEPVAAASGSQAV